jgi:hypothetical protein|tara:strand:+ start:45872 stop:46024 length:153 start_codon:yes stop_codon:yes gene_type:complete
MNVLLGILIIFVLLFPLGKFMGLLGEKFAVVMMTFFALTLFLITVGYAFV